MESRTDLDSISLGSEFRDRGSLVHSSLSFISVQSLSSARGSTPLTKKRNRQSSGRRYYDATQPMENDYEVPIYRLKCLQGLHNSGFIRLGNKELDTKTRRAIDEYLKNNSRYPANTTRPRKDFPTLRSKSKTVNNFKSKQLENYFYNEHINARKVDSGSKSVTFTLPSNKRQNSESIFVKRPIVTVFQDNSYKPKTSVSRPCADKLLLRRPTTKPTRTKVDEKMCFSIAKSVNLRPFNFKSVNDQTLFYTTNFPLLLDAHSDEKTTVQKRIPSPDEKSTAEREARLNTRLTQLESSLDTLDKETEDVDFKTVLRDDVFYPNKWPWNEKKSSDYELTGSSVAY